MEINTSFFDRGAQEFLVTKHGLDFEQAYYNMKKKILIADDDESIRDVLAMILERAGYDVELWPNGSFIHEQPEHYPHVYLIDRQMPYTDGLEVCRQLKRNEATRSIPVIMISATPNIKNLSAEAGANDCIEKPFDIAQLLQTISECINKVNGVKRF